MHPSVMAYVVETVGTRGPFTRILDVGSYDDKGDAPEGNGSVRELFESGYTGVDVREGPGVDRMIPPHELPYPPNEFDLVVSTEMLEHASLPWRIVTQMYRVLKPGGTLILTARGFDGRGCYPVHGEPDLWRFTCAGLADMVVSLGAVVLDCRPDPDCPGVFLHAVKP